MFELELPKEIQHKINDTEKQLREEMDRDTLHEEKSTYMKEPWHSFG